MKILKPLLTVLAFCVFNFLYAQVPIKYSINSAWKFIKNDVPEAVNKEYDDGQWTKVNIPHTYNTDDIMDDVVGYYQGPTTYRKNFYIPNSYKGKKISLYFEGVSSKCEVYLNNRYVGNHIGAYTAFVFDVEGAVDYGKNNVLTVKVDNASNQYLEGSTVMFSYW